MGYNQREALREGYAEFSMAFISEPVWGAEDEMSTYIRPILGTLRRDVLRCTTAPLRKDPDISLQREVGAGLGPMVHRLASTDPMWIDLLRVYRSTSPCRMLQRPRIFSLSLSSVIFCAPCFREQIPSKEWYCSPCSAGVHPSTLVRICYVAGPFRAMVFVLTFHRE